MATGICLSAQVPEKEILQTPTDTAAVTVAVPEGYMLADSIVVRPADPVDSTLAGLNIFSVMPSKEKGGNADVKVHQSQYIRDAILQHIGINGTRTMDGYRVRIFFDNRQTARTESEAALLRFSEGHPGISAYRSYANPYFKVTVGDFRTKSEAMQMLMSIREEFPTAFIVKEKINYPVADRQNPVVTDTIQILRPVETISL